MVNGGRSNASKENKIGKISLTLWPSYFYYIKSKNLKYSGVQRLDVQFDEIWTWLNDDYLTPTEKQQLKNELDIYKVYWRDNKVQAATVEKKYTIDPSTGIPLSKPMYKITSLDDRLIVLRHLPN